MDGERFDALVRLLQRPLPRRRAVQLVAGGLACAAVGGALPRAAAAAVCPERVPKPGHQPTANGCGPDGYDWVVPDTWRKASFTGACNRHDHCYETCNADRLRCDQKFLRDLYGACDAAYPPKRLRKMNDRCRQQARFYYEAVWRNGQAAYEDAQAKACDCCDTETTGPKCGDVCCAVGETCGNPVVGWCCGPGEPACGGTCCSERWCLECRGDSCESRCGENEVCDGQGGCVDCGPEGCGGCAPDPNCGG